MITQLSDPVVKLPGIADLGWSLVQYTNVCSIDVIEC